MPEIEIWNLDSEACEPVALLGSVEKSEKSKKKKFQKYKHSEDIGTHTEAVLSLSLNPI